MKTELTEQENGLFEFIKEDDLNNANSYCKIIYRSDFLDFEKMNLSDLKDKENFFKDSKILFDCKGYYIYGKIREYFWFMDENKNIFFVSKNFIDIPIHITILTSYLYIDDDPTLEEFWEDRQYQYHGEDNVKKIYDNFVLIAKKYGYDFNLKKNIDNYESVEEEVIEFNNILASYGIVNKRV